MKNKYAKIIFNLEIDEDGYPPSSAESLNAIKLENGNFQIDNTPFFIEGIALEDIVKATSIPEVDGKFIYSEHVSFSQSQSLSIIFLDFSFIEGISTKLKSLGCYCEYGEWRNGHLKMLAVSVPSKNVHTQIMPFLLKMQADGYLSVAELSLRNFN